MNWPAATIQCLAIGFAIFAAYTRIWPRWLGYFNIWCGFIFAAGGLVVLFKDGVFAWNGLLAFWMVAVFFGLWFLIMAWQLWVSVAAPEGTLSPLRWRMKPSGVSRNDDPAPAFGRARQGCRQGPTCPRRRGHLGFRTWRHDRVRVCSLRPSCTPAARTMQYSHCDHAELHVALGTLNTVLLLTSSLLVALAIQRVLAGRHAGAWRLITAALCCGAGFVAVKGDRMGPAVRRSQGSRQRRVLLLLLHVHRHPPTARVIGLAILSRVIVVVRQPEFTDKQARLCETGGIFWHMVDLLWVVLFALFYLVR